MASTGLNSSGATADATASQAVLVVGLLSYQDAQTIGALAAAVREGLARNLGGLTHRIVLVDSGSTDNTPARVSDALGGSSDFLDLSLPRATVDLVELPYHGIPGKARALHTILTAAGNVDARACVILDGGVRMTPHWVEA